MKCIGCGKTGFDCINEYCLDCAAQQIGEYDLLKKNLESAIEPVRSWYGDVERPVALVVVDAVADLQKDRTKMLELCLKISELNKAELRRVAELHDVYSLKTKLQHSLHETRVQLVKLAGWCEKTFGVSVPVLLATAAELNTISDAVIQVVSKQIEKLNEDLERALKDVTMFEDLASKAETARVVRLETCLREIAKSPNWRGVPNWVVLKIQEVVGC